MVTMPVMAAEQPELPTKVQDIANGSDDIYGEGVPIEHGTNPDERFSSGGADHTHKYIVANALIILSNDRGNSCKLCLNGMPVPLLRNCYSIFNGTKYC